MVTEHSSAGESSSGCFLQLLKTERHEKRNENSHAGKQVSVIGRGERLHHQQGCGHHRIVTRNIVFNKNKKRVNENLFKTSVLVAYGNEGYYNSTTVEEDYCASQLKIFIDRLINSLPEQQRKCFLLSREENLSYKEIAERLGISQKTVEIHMGKALKFLKDKVKRGWEILLSLLSF